MAILAGGRATRLLPLTRGLPKALVVVAGKPFVLHQIALLRRHGLRRLVLCVGHLGHQIQAFLQDGRDHGVEIEYVFDGAMLLGTAGALKKALPLLGDRFFVLYGDAYLDIDYDSIEVEFLRRGGLGLMTVYRNRNRWGTSNVLVVDGEPLHYSKESPTPQMEHIDFGLSVLHRDALSDVPEDTEFDLGHVYQQLIQRRHLTVLEVGRRFYQIGSPRGLRETRAYLARRRHE